MKKINIKPSRLFCIVLLFGATINTTLAQQDAGSVELKLHSKKAAVLVVDDDKNDPDTADEDFIFGTHSQDFFSSGFKQLMRIKSGNGNVGIGMEKTTHPEYRLDIFSHDFTGARFKRRPSSTGGIGIKLENGTGDGEWVLGVGQNNHFGIFKQGETFGSNFTILDNGFVGIGTTSPEHKLHVKDGAIQMERNGIKVQINDDSDMTAGWIGTITNHPLLIGTNNGARMYLDQAGNVGIGKNPSSISTTNKDKFDLFVTTGVLSEDFGIGPRVEWADYVFQENYELPTLEAVEAHIREHKHLPNIPSQATIQKEGYTVHDMNVRLLEKVEELTLYTIEQEKQIDAQNAKIKELEAQMALILAELKKD